MTRNVILFELNEVPFRVLDYFNAARPDSFLARASARMQQYRTSIPLDHGQLDPWISWATLHRGVTDANHGILHLGQNLRRADAEYPPAWQILHRAGISTGVFGSLHSSALPPDYREYAFYLPDYFAAKADAHPAGLQSFQEFNLAMTRASTRNVSRGLDMRAGAQFLAQSPFLGMKPSTAFAIARQLAMEVRRPEAKIRRRNMQPLLMYDLFERQLSRTQPSFATFYTNHVAAAQHRYWAAAFLDAPADVDPGWRTRYANEIAEAMSVFAMLLRRLARWVHHHPDYVIVIAGSMGQDGIPAQKTYEFLTVVDPARFFRAMGVPDGAWALRPAMAPCLSVDIAPEHRDRFRQRLLATRIDGFTMVKDHRTFHPLCFDEQDDTFMLYIAIDSYSGPPYASVGEMTMPLDALGLGMMAHEDGVNCTAQHVPEGMLLVYDPKRRFAASARPLVSVLDVLPSLLENFGIERPAYLRGQPTISFG